MSAFATLVLYCGVILFVSVLGGLVPGWLTLTHRRMQLALCLVSGVMLGVGMLHMLGHAAEAVVHAHGSGPSMHEVMLAAVAGFLAMFLLERFFCFHHHETPDEHGHTCGHDHGSKVHCVEDAPVTEHRLGWIGALVGLTIHTLLAGIALGAAVASGEAQFAPVGPAPVSADGMVFGLLGFTVFLGIVLHKPFDAFTIVALMQRSGRSRAAMHLVNIGFALMIPLGVVLFRLGADLASDAQLFTIYALAFSAGTFICIAASDVLPELQFHEHDRVAMTAMLVLGLAIAWGSGLLEEGGHDHDRSNVTTERETPSPPESQTID
ncbi:MAG: ZIP family metal transporter [Phycisphaerales bacterium]|nr:ZIP family metal transporter [Phycisphaerales bacterium]